MTSIYGPNALDLKKKKKSVRKNKAHRKSQNYPTLLLQHIFGR